MRPNAFGRNQPMEQWFPYPWSTKKMNLKKTGPILCFYMLTALTGPMLIHISIVPSSVYWTGDLSMPSLTFVADRNWEENGLKTGDCFIRKTHLRILLTAPSF